MIRTAPGVYSAPVLLPNPNPNYVFIRGIVIDSLGDLWVADNANGAGGQVYESVNTAGSFGTPTKVGTGWTAPWGMAADTAGNVYVADNGASAIAEISGGVKTILNTGSVNQPRGIAVDSSGNIFAMDGSIFQVEKLVSPYTSATTVNSTVLSGAGDIALDASGNIWVANYGSNMINELTAASGYLTIQNWGALNGPVAVWPDADGTWLVSEYNDNQIRKVATGPLNMGTVAVNSTSGTQTLSFTFTGAGSTTILAPAVVTLGATGQDYIDAGGGTCAAGTFATGSSCTVNVSLKPKHAGPLYGALNLVDAGNNVLASNLIYGMGSGPLVVFPGDTATQTLGGGFTTNIRAIAADGAGNLYVADKSSTGILKVPVGCTDSSCVVTLGGGFSSPTGVALDGSGNIYVADSGNAAVKEMPANCASSTCVTPLGAGFITPQGVAVDGVGNVYVADNGNNAVDEMPAGCASAGCVTSLGSGLGSPTSVAVDGSGNVYAAGSGYVKEMTPGCNSGACVTTLGAGFNTPIGVAVDASGNVYVSDYSTNLVSEMPAACASSACVATLGTGFSSPAGIALDGSGNVYVGDSGNSAVKELTLTTPPSLSFASTKAGTQSTDSPQAVALGNIGNAALTFPVPTTGNNPSVAANFSLDASTTCPNLTTSSSPGTVAPGTTCNLEVDFVPITIGSISGQAVLMDDNLNANPAVTQSIGLSGSANSPIMPYARVNGGVWQQVPNVTVNPGDTVDLAGKPLTGTWSWTGPNGFTASTREIDAVALPSGTNVYTATYTDTNSNTSTLSITVTVNPTSIVPYVQVNNGPWQAGVSSVTVNAGDTVNLGGQPQSTGTWSWTGPNGFSASTRTINAVPLPSPTNTYTLTYTNTSAVQSIQTFTITVKPTPIVAYVQVNGGGWQQTATPSVNASDTVNLAGQVQSTGSWSWSGANGATASGRILTVPLTSSPINWTLTYTNTSGAQSTQVFTVTVKPTTIVPNIQVNSGAYQQVATITVNAGDTVNLNPGPATGGTWSWTGPGGFTSTSRMLSAVPLTSASNVYTATYTNTAGVQSTQAFTLNVSSTPTPITPYIQVNGGSWQQLSSVTINAGDTVNLGGYPLNGGSWSWSGPSGFTASGRVISASTLNSASNVYTATYTNIVGVNSTQNFTIHVNSTPIVPYIQVNGGSWQHPLSSITVNATDTVNLAGQLQSTGSWSWVGPNGFSASTRIITAPFTSATNTFTLTYTNSDGVQSTQAFTVHVNSTTIVPYIQVNGGAWQHPLSSVTVNAGDSVNLAGQVLSTGTWSWSGPNSFTASGRVLNAAPLTSATNTFTLTYTNSANVQSTQAFTIHVNSTPIVPYVQVNGGSWQSPVSSVTVNASDTVNLGGQPQSTGTWHWSGPNGYTASTRIINAVPLTSATNTFTLTYTNSAGVQSTQSFTVTVKSTPIVPYIQVNGGGWQQKSTASVTTGATVNLGGQLQSTGSWSWVGPNGYTASGRIASAVPLTSGANNFTLTYTNSANVQSTQVFTITLN